MNIMFHKPYITDDEINEVVESVKSGWLTTGKKTLLFEEEFRKVIGSKYSFGVASATAALHLALKAVGIKENDEVILPTNTFIATAEVVTYFGAIPVLCDIEYETHNIDVKKIEPLITKKTKAIIPVHFGGQPCDMDEIYNIAKKYNLYVVEDAAHAFPSYYKNNIVGNLHGSDVTCFSFYATKTLATGEGGMATTNNDNFASKIKVNRLHGINRDVWDRYRGGDWYYEVIDNGYKYNLTDVCSAIGLAQLKKAFWMNDEREKIARKYSEAFANSKIEIPFIKDDRKTSWHLYVIKVNNRDELYNKLKENGINTSVHFIPVHKHPYYKEKYGYREKDYPIANEVFRKSLSLPIYPGLKDEEIEYIIEKVLTYSC
ncbi:MAG: DegT/DnrJ/EryC1/StrS family aminotransferase [Spirochaetes bacterium]|nr:DegT/DnrJ/EryC1/StrS family aminotransferase [Spirochaetota bacterium]